MRPTEHLIALAREFPDLWSVLENMRSERGKSLPRWADWCYLPLAAAYAYVSGGGDNRVPLERSDEIARIGALAAWRVTRGIYRFDSTIFDGLWNTPVEGDLPSDLLYRLPEWCCYVETPGREILGDALYGFYVHLEEDQNTSDPELRFLLDREIGFLPIIIHLRQRTLEEAIRQTLDEAREQQIAALGTAVPAPPRLAEVMTVVSRPLVSLTLYLCSAAADMRDARGTDRQPERPQPKKTKRGLRLFSPHEPTTWEVGYRLGPALRRAYQESDRESGGGTHASPRPHIRRAHWHSFWTGPRKEPDKQTLLVKWLPPIPVGFDETELDRLIPTIRRVD